MVDVQEALLQEYCWQTQNNFFRRVEIVQGYAM